MLLEVDPVVLRSRRNRLGLSQGALARRADTDRERIAAVEKRIVGHVLTYIIINKALDEAEAEQQKAA